MKINVSKLSENLTKQEIIMLIEALSEINNNSVTCKTICKLREMLKNCA